MVLNADSFCLVCLSEEMVNLCGGMFNDETLHDEVRLIYPTARNSSWIRTVALMPSPM